MSKAAFGIHLADLAEFLGTPAPELAQQLRDLIKNHPGSGLPAFRSTHVHPDLVRALLQSRGYAYPQQTVSFQMLKGGVAKTTSALNFGMRAAMYGAQVLMVDLDQQANLSFALGVEDAQAAVWVDVVEEKISVDQAVRNVAPHLDLIPSNLNNSVIERVLMSSSRNWIKSVEKPLAALRHRYDLIVIDTAPNISWMNTAVSFASDVVVLPVSPDLFSLVGAQKHLADLENIKEEFGASFESRVLFTKFDGREASSAEILSRCLESFQDKMLQNYVRVSAEVKSTWQDRRTSFPKNLRPRKTMTV